MTSHDVVYRVRRSLGIKKVGHAGTLDPLATGLLVLAVGPATRFLRYLDLEPKEYVFTATFGAETDTYDSDGETVREAPVPVDLEAQVLDRLVEFVGEIEQLPPMFSAVKTGGRKLYEYARRGEVVERTSRPVTVYSLELLPEPRSGTELSFRCVCSGGTYVRTIAHDLGRAIGCGAHVSSLRRTRVGRFSLDGAVGPDEAVQEDLVPMAEALEPMPVVRLNDAQVYHVQHGNFLRVTDAPNEPLAVLVDESGQVVCVARVVENELHPECVVAMEAAHGAV